MKNFLIISFLFIILNHTAIGQPELTSKTNVVTSNVDAIFEITNLNNDTLSFGVYNRWGELIITNKDLIVASGTYELTFNLKEFPEQATYYYIISTNDSSWNGSLTALYPAVPEIEVLNSIITDTTDLTLSIFYLTKDTVTITLFDVYGETIKTLAINQILDGEQEFVLNSNDFEKDGNYYLNIKINDSTTVKRFVVTSALVHLDPSFYKNTPHIYPNPFSDNVFIHNKEKLTAITLSTTKGEMIWTGNNSPELTTLLESIETGSYIIQYDVTDQIFTEKIIKK